MKFFKKVNEWRLKAIDKIDGTKEKIDNKQRSLEIETADPYKIRDKLSEREGFITDKAVKVGGQSILVDNEHKKFAMIKSTNYKVYGYNDLLDFELNEDGNSIVKGKTASTVAGGLMFGPIGAIAGASGRKKVDNECTYMAVRLLLNDLDNPELNIELIKRSTSKESGAYKKKLKEAQAATALLTYIQNNA